MSTNNETEQTQEMETLKIELTPKQLQRIQIAAEVTHYSINDFIIFACGNLAADLRPQIFRVEDFI